MRGRRRGAALARSWAVALTLLLAASSAAAAPAPRIYAIAYRHLPAHAESYEAYRNHMMSLATAAIGADTETPRVLVFPENSALYAMFMGARGLPFQTLEPLFRQGGGNGAAAAIVGLFGAYQAQAVYYRAKFPAQNLSQARVSQLALTDTLYRSFFETFRAIAIARNAWVVTSANIAPAFVQTNPAIAALLADPEAAGAPCVDETGAEHLWPCAYEAATERFYNQAFVFDPTGKLIANPWPEATEGPLDGAIKKTYLVPDEQGPVEQGKVGLDIAYGDLRQVRPLEIAGVPMGIVISKPAWMLDELGRLESYDAQVILQPEAFSSWGLPESGDSSWSPDVLKQSGWSHTQKYAPFRYSVLSELTGNFFDLTFDAQNHIVGKATAKAPVASSRYIGEPDDVGWEAVTPWVAGDQPGDACDASTLALRRACLAEFGAKLAPASGDPLENQYPEESIAATLDLGAPAADMTSTPAALGTNQPLEAFASRQRNPKIALAPNGRAAFVVWQDDRTGTDRIRIARIRANGTPTASREVAPGFGGRQIDPQVAVHSDGTIHVVWQELEPTPRLYRIPGRWTRGSFVPRTPPASIGDVVVVAPGPIVEKWKPSIALGEAGKLHIAWIGLTGGFERLFYEEVTFIEPSGASGPLIGIPFGFAIDEDAFAAPDPLASNLNNRWNPSIAVRTLDGGSTTIAIAWSDFRNYAWDIFAVVSTDGGITFPPHLRVDDSLTPHERLHNDPSVLIAADGTVHAAWSDQGGRRVGCENCPEQRRPDTDIVAASMPPGGSFGANVRVDDSGNGLGDGDNPDRRSFSNQWRPALAELSDGRLAAVWQDHREGNNDIYMSIRDGTWGPNARVDDTGAGHSNQYSPAVAARKDGRLIVVWQDDRNGQDRIYAAIGKP